ncbi:MULTISPECIES: TonB-dependent receptor [Sphingobium]|jgi:iron complex outermembrane receptor protein|uniref:TonB-dependent receptor n=1 Tax=Sphingobium TaxID=165695 RepID=UPI000DBB2CB0|nr:MULTISPECIES: TonB-dependent receptor [Sphingobium]KAA9020363.1 TonB-dependent receptor [Sphingobium limneticum]MBU0931620.1 TonB-dependent receptor [Alphaproteobacteria bacterium]BBD02935.1 iron complex outermembrane recepter protein [Sphingobium sp. YG1]
MKSRAAMLFNTTMLSVAGLAPGVPLAQAAEADDIVVTAARSVLPANALPLTIDVIDQETLNQQVAIGGSIVDAVSTLTPSFSPTRQKLSGAGETLRGRSPLYAINGIPQTAPLRDGARDGFTIDPFFVDRVELIYGSNALQGIGGTGGIVNQVTAAPAKSDGLSGRMLVQGNADTGFHGDGIGGKVAGLLAWRGGRWDAMIGAAYEKRGTFYDGHGDRVGTDLTQGETQDSRSWSLFGRFGYALSDTARIDLTMSRFQLKGEGDYIASTGNYRIDLPTTSVRGTPPGVPATSRTESAALTLTDTDLAGGNLIAQLFFNRSRDTYGGEIAPIATFQIVPGGTLFDQSQNRSRKYGGKLSYERTIPGFEALTAIVGVDALYDLTEQRLIATGRTWVPPTDYRSIAPFAQANLALFDKKLRIAAGVRHEDVKIGIDDYTTLASYGGFAVSGGTPRFSDTLVNGGVILEPWTGIRAYASYAEGYTVPDVGRIARAVGTPGVDIDDYVNIEPIVSNNREIGMEVKRGPIDASAAYFWSTSKNGSLLVQTAIGAPFEIQRQRVEIQGLELNLSVKMPLPGLTLSTGYAHLIGRTDGSDNGVDVVDRDLDGANISPDRLNVAASYAHGPISARIQTQFFLARQFERTPGNYNPLYRFDGYDVTDLSLRYQTGFGALTLAAQNIFDTFYIDYYSQTVRPNDNAHYFAGRGRNFTLSWDYRF